MHHFLDKNTTSFPKIQYFKLSWFSVLTTKDGNAFFSFLIRLIIINFLMCGPFFLIYRPAEVLYFGLFLCISSCRHCIDSDSGEILQFIIIRNDFHKQWEQIAYKKNLNWKFHFQSKSNIF